MNTIEREETPQIPVYAIELVCERMLPGPLVTGPGDVARFVVDYLRRADREHFVVVMLATSGRIIGVHTAHIGSVNASLVRTADVFKAVVLANATSIVVAHNHPSGNVEPSAEDIAVTRKLVDAGKLLDVRVLDSLIVSPDGAFTSLAERGMV